MTRVNGNMSELRRANRGALVGLLGTILLAAFWGCAGLIPQELRQDTHMKPVLPEGRGDFTIDLVDSSTVFSKEGLLIRVRHMTAQGVCISCVLRLFKRNCYMTLCCQIVNFIRLNLLHYSDEAGRVCHITIVKN